MRRREAIVAALTAMAGCAAEPSDDQSTDAETTTVTTEEAQDMVDKLNLSDVEVNKEAFENQDMMRAVDKEAGLVYIMTDGYNSVSLETVPIEDTELDDGSA